MAQAKENSEKNRTKTWACIFITIIIIIAVVIGGILIYKAKQSYDLRKMQRQPTNLWFG